MVTGTLVGPGGQARGKRLLGLAGMVIGIACALLASGAVAGERHVEISTAPKSLIELFTSQGCSSCPPADALLERYAERDDLVALTFHVDYWDYLGWKDTNARPEFSERQRAYAQRRGDGMVYTPQVVVNGIAHAVGSKREAIDAALEQTVAGIAAQRQILSIEIDGKRLKLTRAPGEAGGTLGEVRVWLALASRRTLVDIGRGENSGRTVTYNHVVRDLVELGTWAAGSDSLEVETARMGDGVDGCIAFVQDADGAILAAVDLWLPGRS